MSNSHFFENRKILIVTKHGKEKIISESFEKSFGIKTQLATLFDTDSLGTFTREIERKDDALTTLRKKCEAGMQAENFDLAIATEASFGAHPSVFFAAAHEEWIMLKDTLNTIEIVEKTLVTNTNFNHQNIKNWNDLKNFAIEIGFPEAGIILKFQNHLTSFFIKDIKNWQELEKIYQTNFLNYTCEASTDMRAMNNPLRMKVIEDLTQKLIQKIKSLCPSCNSIGFGIINANKGLPCSLCNFPTQSILSLVLGCLKCNYTEIKMFPNNVESEDPMYCNYCNP